MLVSTGILAVEMVPSKGPTTKSCSGPFFWLYIKTATSPSFTRNELPNLIAFSRLVELTSWFLGLHFHTMYSCSSQRMTFISPPPFPLPNNPIVFDVLKFMIELSIVLSFLGCRALGCEVSGRDNRIRNGLKPRDLKARQGQSQLLQIEHLAHSHHFLLIFR